MKYGVNTFIWTDRFGREQVPLLARIKSAGFDGVEVPLFSPNDYADSEVRRALRDSGLERTVCSVIPSGMSLVEEDASVRRKTQDHMRACVTACGNWEPS